MSYVHKKTAPGYKNPRAVDIRGQKYGAWTVVGSYLRNENGHTVWPCRCDCGTLRNVVGQPLRAGKTKSCGCLMGEAVAASKTTHGQAANSNRANPKDVSSQAAVSRDAGSSVSNWKQKSDYRRVGITYKRWLSMKKRVRDKSPDVWKHYGGKGIAVCDRWHVFENFLADMGECPKDFTLDRIDPKGNYEPSNCRWATWAQQVRNRTMLELCPQCGKKRETCGSDRLEAVGTG